MAQEGCLSSLAIGIGGFAAIAALAWLLSPTITEEDKEKADYCQNQAVAMDLGVVYDKQSGRYYYSENKIKQLQYYRFMYKCLPDSYPSKLDIKRSLSNLEEDLGIGR